MEKHPIEQKKTALNSMAINLNKKKSIHSIFNNTKLR